MTFVVPFDGSKLAEAALIRAAEFGKVLNERVVAVSIIPQDDFSYANTHGWVEPGEEFDVETIVSQLHKQVTKIAPSADFRHETVGRFATSGTIALALRRIAKNEKASMVFIGSENAGRLVSSLTSVGSMVSADQLYDVVIVRTREPSKVERHREKSNFYQVD
ncbi:universal stress protein [Haladaptatus sp. DJG-WS-42]|uniref:universal stress protein n=1 Tax=Haladaptatus sp. DJG-WS-42 TaxID=3120516 RepID=UPI0030D15200